MLAVVNVRETGTLYHEAEPHQMIYWLLGEVGYSTVASRSTLCSPFQLASVSCHDSKLLPMIPSPVSHVCCAHVPCQQRLPSPKRTGMVKALNAEALEFTVNALSATREKLDLYLSKLPPDALREARAELKAEGSEVVE